MNSRKGSSLASFENKAVGGNDGGSPAIGDNRKARTTRKRLSGEHVEHIEHLGHATDAQDPGLSKRGFYYIIAAGKRTGMGSRGFGGCGSASSLENDDWFPGHHFARRQEKGARIADRFHIKDNAACARIVAKVTNEIPHPTPASIQWK